MKGERIQGLDYIRAIMSVFVVALHMEAAGKSLIFSPENYLQHTLTFSDFVNFQLLRLAVPAFIFVSCFLYVLHGASGQALKKRFKRLIVLLVFWPLALNIFQHGYPFLYSLVPHSPEALVTVVLRAGNTVYYFFVSLMFCLFVAHCAARLGSRGQIAGFIASLVVVACLPLITMLSQIHLLSAYWNPMNFIAFPFAAVLVARNGQFIDSRRTALAAASLALCSVFAILEWRYLISDAFFPGPAIPAYTRVSLVFGVLSLSILALKPGIRSGPVTRFMATYALSLYCIHPFLMGPVGGYLAGFAIPPALKLYASLALVILLSYVLGPVLRLFLKDELLL